MALRTATQNIQLTGRLTYMKLKEKETLGKSKKVVQKVNFGMQLNNRTSVFVESTLWNMDNPANFTQQKFKEYMHILERFNSGDDVYISTTIKPSKDGSMFDKLSMYEKKDGTTGMSIQASVNYRKHVMDGDEPIITFETRNSSFEKPFSDCHPKFTFEMVVEEMVGQLLQLTDGKDNFPTRVIGRLPDDMPNLAKIGQGYQFSGELKKGARIDRPAVTSHAWEEEAKTVAEYESDYFILTPTGIVRDLTLDIVERPETDYSPAPRTTSTAPSRQVNTEIVKESNTGLGITSKPSKLGDTDDLPF